MQLILILMIFSLLGDPEPEEDYPNDYDTGNYEPSYYYEWEWERKQELYQNELKVSPGSTTEYEAWVEKAKANPPRLCLPEEKTREKK